MFIALSSTFRIKYQPPYSVASFFEGGIMKVALIEITGQVGSGCWQNFSRGRRTEDVVRLFTIRRSVRQPAFLP